MSGLKERAAGSLVGLALGDALGAPFEGRRAHDIPDPVPDPPGRTTDDTAMARNLARSLVDRRGFDPDDLAAKHLAWFEGGPPDVESLTRRVLSRATRGVRSQDAARKVWEERGPEVSAGNGSVMYCGPIGAAYALVPERLHDVAPALSALTHFDERSRTAVLAVALAVAALVRGEDPGTALGEALGAALPREGGEELEYLVDAIGPARPVDGPDRGFCLFAAAVGLQALGRGGGFEEGLRRVVSLGGDTDTNAAVAGGLLGAREGLDGLPAGWLDRLRDRDEIVGEARALGDLAAAGPRS